MNEENTAASTLLEITPKQLFRHIQYAIYSKRSPFVWGDPGIGKSAIIAYIAEKFGYHFEDVRLSQIDSIDLRGLPVKSYFEFEDDEVATSEEHKNKGAIVEWAMPDFLARAREAKLRDGKNTMFFFDEFNSAAKNTLAAAYQLVLDKKIGCFELGENDVVMAAGNFETNGGVTTMMPTPLANRFIHYNLKVSANEWLDYAYNDGIHPWITAFIERHKNLLHTFTDDSINEDEKAYGTPRSWHAASDTIHNILSQNVALDMFSDGEEGGAFAEKTEPHSKEGKMEDIKIAVAGSVGRANAEQFMAYVRVGMDLPKPDEILSGEVTKAELGDISKEYILSNSCLHELKTRNEKYKELREAAKNASEGDEVHGAFAENEVRHFKDIENFVKFAKENFSSETFIYAIVTSMIRRHKIQPHPNKIDKDVFKMITVAFERASGRGDGS